MYCLLLYYHNEIKMQGVFAGEMESFIPVKKRKKVLTKGFYSGILTKLSGRIVSENVIILKCFRKIKNSVDK